MPKLFLSAIFKKEVMQLKEKELHNNVETILDEMLNVLESPEELATYLKSLKAKKFQNLNGFWKFYATNAHRVIYTFGKSIGRFDESESLFIIRYVSDHDAQSRLAVTSRQRAEKGEHQPYRISSKERSNEDAHDEKLAREYDVEQEIHYSLVKGKIAEILYRNIYETESLFLNREQLKCMQLELPMVVIGSAGSGKTIVSIEFMKQISNECPNAIYITFTEFLKSFAKEQFEIYNKKNSGNFYTYSDYCIQKLKLESMNLIGFGEFEKWYKRSFPHLKFETYDVWAEIRGVIKGYMGEKCEYLQRNESMLSEKDYLQDNISGTRFEDEDKAEIYNIARKYMEWLIDSGKYDDNDLAHRLLEGVKNQSVSMEELLVVDEVQDLTERQITSLLKITEKRQLFFSGDPNQIINPSYFSFSRFGVLLYNKEGQNPNRIFLKHNYRNCKQIVQYINLINDERIKYIGSQKQEYDSEEYSMRQQTEGDRIFLIKPSQDNMAKLIELFEENPDCAIIVTTSKEKTELERHLKGKKRPVYTIYEVKGLEFRHVLCYNLFSTNQALWQEILDNKGRRSTQHRFLFNVFYVALTRAKEYLCFFEENFSVPFIEEAGTITLEQVNFDSLYLHSGKGPLAWYEEAVKFEKAGMYDQAESSYHRYSSLSNDSVENEILRCQAYGLIEREKTTETFRKAGYLLLKAEEYDEAIKYFKEVGDLHKALECEIRRAAGADEVELGKYNLETVLNKGVHDQEFMDVLLDSYLSHKASDVKQQSKDIIELYIPSIKEV